MDERKSPPRLPTGKAGSIIAFPITTATCSCCGYGFHRRRGESWKRLCLDCWRWQKVGQALSLADALLGRPR